MLVSDVKLNDKLTMKLITNKTLMFLIYSGT